MGDWFSVNESNTTHKYAVELENKQLIRTEPTTIVTKDGRKRNGTLRYHIRPIQEAVDYYNEQQLHRSKMDVEQRKAQARLSRLCAPQKPLPAAGRPADTPSAVKRRVEAVWPAYGVRSFQQHRNEQGKWAVENTAG